MAIVCGSFISFFIKLLFTTSVIVLGVSGLKTNTQPVTCGSLYGVQPPASDWRCPCAGGGCQARTDLNVASPSVQIYNTWEQIHKTAAKAGQAGARLLSFQKKLLRISTDDTAIIDEEFDRLGLVRVPQMRRPDARKLRKVDKRKPLLEHWARTLIFTSEYLRKVLVDELNSEDRADCSRDLMQREYFVYDKFQEILCNAHVYLRQEYDISVSDVITQTELDNSEALNPTDGALGRTNRFERDYVIAVYVERVLSYTKDLAKKMVPIEKKAQRRAQRIRHKDGKDRNRRNKNKRGKGKSKRQRATE